MLSSSAKNDAKQEVRFAARLDVLGERVDTLASTVATTASAMAKKDGEIASLRRDFQARDEALQALMAQARAAQTTPSGPALDADELRSLRNAVAALTKEHAQGGSTTQIEELRATVRSLAERFEGLSSSTSTTAARTAADHTLKQRLSALEIGLAAVNAQAEQRATDHSRGPDELLGMLERLRLQVEAFGSLPAGLSEEQLDQRIAETDDALGKLGQRIDSLARHVESATSSLGDKEHELAVLRRHFNESSTRIESIVGDIREALSAFPDGGSASFDELSERLERVEKAAREGNEARARSAEELARRIDVIDARVATVATELARAKTLWPVALRSLEARLDDVAHTPRPEPATDDELPPAPEEHDRSDDLLAGLRDSLHAMETVAAEMSRASDALSGSSEGADAPTDTTVAAAGATIVPLRTGEP